MPPRRRGRSGPAGTAARERAGRAPMVAPDNARPLPRIGQWKRQRGIGEAVASWRLLPQQDFDAAVLWGLPVFGDPEAAVGVAFAALGTLSIAATARQPGV